MKDLPTKRLNYLEDFFMLMEQNVSYCRITQDGIIIEASDIFCKLTQYTKEELQGEYYSVINSDLLMGKSYYELWNILKKKQKWDGEFLIFKKNGDRCWVDVKISPQYEEHGDFLCFMMIHQDITAKKQVKLLNNSLELNILKTANESMKVHHLNITLEKRVQKARRIKEKSNN
jgi:PAS domain S-box-containing protein